MAEKKPYVGSFRELEVYKKALIFSNKIYKIIEDFPFYESHNLCDQLRRASSSIFANIAEGSGNYYYGKEFDRLNTALASLCECRAFLDMAVMQKYISRETYDSLDVEAEEILKMLIGMLNRIEKILGEEAS